MTDSKPMRAELVDDYRIKCALLLEEVIDAEEAAKLAAAEIAELRSERDRLQLANARMKAALEAISEGDKPTTYMHLGTALAIARKALGGAS